jgi:hypothetical protein
MANTYPEEGGPSDDGADRQDPGPQARGAGETKAPEAAHFADAAKAQVSERIDSGKTAAADALSIFADAIRRAGEELGQNDQTMVAGLVGQAAEGLESLSRTVSQKQPKDLLLAARDFGRSNPGAFMAGAVLAGVALGRFARSSAPGAESKDPSSGSSSAAASVSGDLGPLSTYETPGVADPIAAELSRGLQDVSESTAVQDDATPMAVAPGIVGQEADLAGSANGETVDDLGEGQAGLKGEADRG